MLHLIVADDHGIVRSGLKMLIERQEGMRVVAEAEDGVEAVEAAIRERPDVAILDVSMPRMTGLQAAREIKAHCPATSVLLLSMHDDERYVSDALRAGRLRLRAQAPGRRRADRGDPRGGRRRPLPVGEHSHGVDEDGDAEPLTPRELDIVKLIAEAYTNRQIAEILQVSEKTVESHRANVLSKLGMRDRVELVRYAIKRGLIEP